jgi:hypothetical protein
MIATLLGICQLSTSPPHDIWVHYWAGTMVLWLDHDDTLNLQSIGKWDISTNFEVNKTRKNHEIQLTSSTI